MRVISSSVSATVVGVPSGAGMLRLLTTTATERRFNWPTACLMCWMLRSSS